MSFFGVKKHTLNIFLHLSSFHLHLTDHLMKNFRLLLGVGNYDTQYAHPVLQNLTNAKPTSKEISAVEKVQLMLSKWRNIFIPSN